MEIGQRAVGLGMCIAGVILWLTSLILDAPTVSVVLSILIFMAGAVLFARGDASG